LLSGFINTLRGPEDLAQLQNSRPVWARRITDADGDGIEDNVHLTPA